MTTKPHVQDKAELNNISWRWKEYPLLRFSCFVLEEVVSFSFLLFWWAYLRVFDIICAEVTSKAESSERSVTVLQRKCWFVGTGHSLPGLYLLGVMSAQGWGSAWVTAMLVVIWEYSNHPSWIDEPFLNWKGKQTFLGTTHETNTLFLTLSAVTWFRWGSSLLSIGITGYYRIFPLQNSYWAFFFFLFQFDSKFNDLVKKKISPLASTAFCQALMSLFGP